MDRPPENDRPVDRIRYTSIVMSLMYLARLTRPDILFGVTYLSQFCQSPTIMHLNACVHILNWIRVTSNWGLKYNASGGSGLLKVYCDSSHGSHLDGRGHLCWIATVNGTVVGMRSAKVGMVTLSSTETEQCAMCEAATFVKWWRAMLPIFSCEVTGPIPIYHDNLSTIWLQRRDGSFARTKHIMIRRNYSREMREAGEIVVIHMNTEDMAADMGTKYTPGPALKKHCKFLGLKEIPE
jgi:hypothetical protein